MSIIVWPVLAFYSIFKNTSSYLISEKIKYLGKRLSYLILIIFQKPYGSYFQMQRCFNRVIKFSIFFGAILNSSHRGVSTFDLILLLGNESIYIILSTSMIFFLYIKIISLWNIKTVFESDTFQILELSTTICFSIYQLDIQKLWTNSLNFQWNFEAKDSYWYWNRNMIISSFTKKNFLRLKEICL